MQSNNKRKRQVWLAGGVGITPFLAALDAMRPDSGSKIDLIYCNQSAAKTLAFTELQVHAARLPQLHLHCLFAERGERFSSLSLNKLDSG